MDWIALTSVISSGVVAISTLIINALTKRGDRQHLTSLEFQKRAWDTKSAALLEIIERCEDIRRAIARSVEHDEDRRKGAVFGIFMHLKSGLSSPELVAYASDSVNGPVKRLAAIWEQALMSDAPFTYAMLADARSEKEQAIDNRRFELAAAVRQREIDVERIVGRESGIEISEVDSLCAEIVKSARKDLRGIETRA